MTANKQPYNWKFIILFIFLFLIVGLAGYIWFVKDYQAHTDLQVSQCASDSLKSKCDQAHADLQACQLAGNSLQAKYDQLYKVAQLMQLRNTVYRQILEKWRLPIPEDNTLETFQIEDYFCQTWCPWIKGELPKVKKDFKDSGCPSCEQAKTPTRSHGCNGNCPTKEKRDRSCHEPNYYPPPPPLPQPPPPLPPSPPLPANGTAEQPTERETFHPGPMAPGGTPPSAPSTGPDGDTRVLDRTISK